MSPSCPRPANHVGITSYGPIEDAHILAYSILENSPDMIKVLDADARIVFTNDRRLNEKAIAGVPWPDCWPTQDRAPVVAAIEAAKHGGRSRFTASRICEEGTRRWFDVRVVPMTGRDGDLMRILAISRDVTEHHLQAEELKLAKDRAEAASRAKAAFLATMSHELRTPLVGILGHVDLLWHDKQLDRRQRHRVSQVREAGLGLLRIVDDVLDIERADDAGLTLNPAEFDVAELVASACDLMRPIARSKGIDLKLVVDCARPHRHVDGGRLRQALLNLLGNALKFTDEGGVLVDLRETEKGGVSLKVEDTGIGVPPECRDAIFERFARARTLDRRRPGVGLGLAITKHIVAALDGTLSYHARAGGGSVFAIDVDLPLADPARAAAGSASPVEGGVKVLVVDDNEMARDVASDLLGVMGCRVDTAASGHEALTLAQEGSYDLVLMDENMPGMSGRETARLMRDIPGCRVVISSADVLLEQTGYGDHLPKPLTVEALASLLGREPPSTNLAPKAEPAAVTRNFEMAYEEFVDLANALAAGCGGRAAEIAHRMVSTAIAVGCLGAARELQALEASLRKSGPGTVRTPISPTTPDFAAASSTEITPCLEPLSQTTTPFSAPPSSPS